MLNATLTKRHSPHEDPVAIIRANQGRIRELCHDALTLAATDGSHVSDVARDAARVRRGLVETLRRHRANQLETIAPMLIADDKACATIFTLVLTQHEMIRDVVRSLFPSWRALEKSPTRIGDLRHRLTVSSRRLTSLLAVHFELEETALFPRIALLPEAKREAMTAEMRNRHA